MFSPVFIFSYLDVEISVRDPCYKLHIQDGY